MGKQVNTGLACLAVGWGWGVADVRGALASESTWSHFALLAATLWAIYIVLGARIATAGSSNGRLTVGFCYATVVGLPLVAVLWPHGAGVPLPTVVGLGILSAAIPYSLDQLLMSGGRGAGAKPFYRRNGGDRRGGGGCGCA